jgi:hypothetical protein
MNYDQFKIQYATLKTGQFQVNVVVQAYNPSTSEGRYQEDHRSRPAQAKSETTSQSYPPQKGLGVWHKCLAS